MTLKEKKLVQVVGGGTVSYVRNHLALSAPAYGSTARRIAKLFAEKYGSEFEVASHLTKMADPASDIETSDHLRSLAEKIVQDPRTKIVIFNAAVVDFDGAIGDVQSGKYSERLQSSSAEGPPNAYTMQLSTAPKIISMFRNSREYPRKDIFLVGFKTTCGATESEQYRTGLNMLKKTSANLVLANDTKTRVNMIIVPEEAAYHVTKDREEVLQNLVEMAYLRSRLNFTRSTIIPGEPVSWNSELIPQTLRTVVDYSIARGAYKPFRGATAGHFAVKLDNRTFLSTRRKTNFNQMDKVGLVKVETDGPNRIIAHGSKPSVGGQSQRILFEEHPEFDCVVHFHCPLKVGSEVPKVSQREFECGSHECGKNTSRGLRQFGNLAAVFLDHHGPNIVFHRSIDPAEVVKFIDENFELREKTGGYALV